MSPVRSVARASRWGFGTYRWSATGEHVAALRRALDLGCTLVDSAPNYASREVRSALGQVLAPYREQVQLISKAGYTGQGGFSLDPDFLRERIRVEADLVGGGYLDTFMLHNPEHLLESCSRSQVLAAVAGALEVCAEARENGLIRSCGISSNVLPDPRSPLGQDTLDEYVALAADAGLGAAFGYVQFPFNVVERGAAAGGLLENCRRHGLVTIGNRPLSARTPTGTIRLADEPAPSIRSSDRLVEELLRIEPGLGWLAAHWEQVRSADALDYLEAVATRAGAVTSASGRGLLRELFLSRRVELRRAAAAQTKAFLGVGAPAELSADPVAPVAVRACRFGLDHLDHILIGLRTVADVDQLAGLLNAGRREDRAARAQHPN